MAAIELSIDGLPAKALQVFEMTGEEALSQLYQFEVACTVQQDAVLPDMIVGRDATLVIAPDGTVPRTISAMVEEVWRGSPTIAGLRTIRVQLVPHLSRLQRYRSSHVFGAGVPVSVADIIQQEMEGALRTGGLAPRMGPSALRHELRLRGSYPQRDHVVQYEETDFAFVSRLAEHWGIFYFFEVTESGDERVVFADRNDAAGNLPSGSTLRWRPWSPGQAEVQPDTIQALDVIEQGVPQRVLLRDYNYRLPMVPLLAEAAVHPDGDGDWVEYGAHFRTPDEGAQLAAVRAEELLCRAVRFHGRSGVPRLAPGRCFSLQRHPYLNWNQDYLVVSVRHKARLPVPGISGAVAAGAETPTGYHNEFTLIPANIAFRPERRTPWPRMDGILNARIDGKDPANPELDDQGRYRMRMPFDFSDAPDGQASRWTRMATPFGGDGDGMHYPLYPGTEVVVGCVNGDPDRPIILGAVPNPRTPSPVTAENRFSNKFTSRHGFGSLMETTPPAADTDDLVDASLKSASAFSAGPLRDGATSALLEDLAERGNALLRQNALATTGAGSLDSAGGRYVTWAATDAKKWAALRLGAQQTAAVDALPQEDPSSYAEKDSYYYNKGLGGEHVVADIFKPNASGFSLRTSEKGDIVAPKGVNIFAGDELKVMTTHGESGFTASSAYSVSYVNSNDVVFGAASEVFFGARNEFVFGVDTSLNISVGYEIFIGLKMEMELGGKLVLQTAPTNKINMHEFELTMGGGTGIQPKKDEISALRNEIVAVDTKVSTVETGLKTAENKITTVETSVATTKTDITTAIDNKITAVKNEIISATDTKISTLDMNMNSIKTEINQSVDVKMGQLETKMSTASVSLRRINFFG